MKVVTLFVAISLVLGLACVIPAEAQEVKGTPGSPESTTTLDGKQLPPPPDTEFGGKSILVTVDGTDTQRFEGRCEVWRIGNERVDLSATLQRLATAGVGRLLVEGGGEFNWQLLRDDLVDEINLTLAPALLGGRDAPTWLEGSGWTMKQQRRLRLQSIERLGDELYLRYLVDRENDGA